MHAISAGIRNVLTPDEGIVLDTLRGRILCRNPVRSKIFAFPAGGDAEAQIGAAISHIYQEDSATVERDVRTSVCGLLGSIERSGAVRVLR